MAGPPPPTQYAASGDVQIAYQVSGAAGPDLVWAPGTASHLDLYWEGTLGPFYEGLGQFCRLIRFDKRGTGLSDRPTDMATLEQRTDDIRAVMDAVGSESAVVLGASEGASMACLFAATYPERTRSLAVWGGQARWVRTDDYPWGLSEQEHRELVEDCRRNWPSEWYIRGPGAGQKDLPPEQLEAMRRVFRAAGSPAAVAAYEEMNGQIDIRDILPTIRVPTLVLNRSGDPVAHVDAARDLAERIPGARFVELPGDSHGVQGVEEQALALLRQFVTGAREPAPTTRQLATILFVDVVGSTERATELGDARWSELLGRLYVLAERELELYAGKGSRSGRRWLARPLRRPHARNPLRARGSVRRTRDRPNPARRHPHRRGRAKQRRRTRNRRPPSGTHRRTRQARRTPRLLYDHDLVAGAGIPFEDRGLHTLKGIHEPRRLFGISGTYGTTQKANRSGVIAEHWPSPAALPPTCSAISPGGAIRSRSKGNREGR